MTPNKLDKILIPTQIINQTASRTEEKQPDWFCQNYLFQCFAIRPARFRISHIPSACLITWLNWTQLIEIQYLDSVHSERTEHPLASYMLMDFMFMWQSLKELLLLWYQVFCHRHSLCPLLPLNDRFFRFKYLLSSSSAAYEVDSWFTTC